LSAQVWHKAESPKQMPASDRPDDKIAERLVREGLRLSDVPVHLEAASSGRFSSAWFVAVKDGPAAGEYVLRIAPSDNVGMLFYERRMMRQEPALHRLIRRRTGVPVPRIVAYDFSRRLIDRDWLIMDRLPGEPLLHSRSGVSAGQLDGILADLGRHVAALHRITGRAFGYRGKHRPMQPQRNWADAFEIMWARLLDDCLATGLYHQDIRDLALGLFAKYRRVFEEPFTPCLCHMDLWAENLLVEGGRLTGLIDLDRACWAEPGIDLAVAEYCGLTRQAFWTGYGGRPAMTDAFRVRRWFYLLYEHQKYIVINALRRRDVGRARGYADECVAMLRRFAATGDATF